MAYLCLVDGWETAEIIGAMSVVEKEIWQEGRDGLHDAFKCLQRDS